MTKSGTNGFHGDLFEFVRQEFTNARNTFAVRRDDLKRHQFGATAGGPIVKNRLFIFGGYQGTRIKTAPPTNTVFVPTCGSAGRRLQHDRVGGLRHASHPARSFHRFAIPGKLAFPPVVFNASALGFLKFVPTSNDPCGKLIIAVPNDTSEDQFLTRSGLEPQRETHVVRTAVFHGLPGTRRSTMARTCC